MLPKYWGRGYIYHESHEYETDTIYGNSKLKQTNGKLQDQFHITQMRRHH